MERSTARHANAILVIEALLAFLALSAGVFFFGYEPAPPQPPAAVPPAQSQPACPDPPAPPPVEEAPAEEPPVEDTSMQAVSVTPEQILDGSAHTVAAEAGANALIVDMKPDSGMLNWVSKHAVAKNVRANSKVEDINERLRLFLADTDLHVIARMSAFRDDLVGYDWGCTVKDTSGRRWTDDEEIHWSSVMNNVVRTYNVQCAVELAGLGFDEILLENISSPDRGDLSRIPGEERFREKAQIYFLEELAAAMEPLDAAVSLRADADVLTAAEPVTALTPRMAGDNFDRIWLDSGCADALEAVGVTADRVVAVVDSLDEITGVPRAVLP